MNDTLLPPDPELERDLRDLFATSPRSAPDATVQAAVAQAAGLPQRRPLFPRLDRRAWPPQARSATDPALNRAVRLAAVAVMVLLLGAIVAFGARLLERPPSVILESGGTLGTSLDAPTAQLWPDGRVLVVGQGRSARLYDPASRTVAAVTFPMEYGSPNVTVLPDGRVLLLGLPSSSDTSLPLNVGFFDTGTGAVQPVGQLEPPQAFAESTRVLRDGRIFISGGTVFPRDPDSCSPLVCEGPPTPAPSEPLVGDLATVKIFDPATGTTSNLAPMLHARWQHTVFELDDGRILIVGGNGQGASATGEVLEVEVYDIARGTSEVVGVIKPLGHPFGAPTLRLADGRILIRSGGFTEWPCGIPTPGPSGPPLGPYLHAEYRQYTHVFDPETNTLVDGPLLPHTNGFPNTIALPDGRALTFGAHTVTPGGCASDDGAYLKSWLGVVDVDANRVYESYNPDTGLSTLPFDALRTYATGVLLPDGRVALIGDSGDDREDNPVDLVTIGP
jgi:hypothetical protein